MDIHKLRIKNLHWANKFDRSKVFEVCVSFAYLFVCIRLALWYYFIPDPTDEQSMVFLEVTSFFLSVFGTFGAAKYFGKMTEIIRR